MQNQFESEPSIDSVDDNCSSISFEEARAVIEAWGFAWNEKQFVLNADEESYAPEVFEPTRLIPDSAPPKRFYRTFWTSVTRRLVAREKEAMLKQK